MAGCSPIREGVLLIKPDTTLADVKKFGEECQRRWGITPLQIFLHKDEGHWLSGQPEAGDRESFQTGERRFKEHFNLFYLYVQRIGSFLFLFVYNMRINLRSFDVCMSHQRLDGVYVNIILQQ